MTDPQCGPVELDGARATSVGCGGSTSIRYGYDAVGNRTTQVDSSGTTTSSYDAADQLQTVIAPSGTTNYGFDANGNNTAAGAWTYAFNLASATPAAGHGGSSVRR
jgi:YD repeat-containing protein